MTDVKVVDEEKLVAIKLEQPETTDPLNNLIEAAPEKEVEHSLKRTLDAAGETDVDGNEAKKPKLPKKKKVAMLMSYCGQGYLGMQKNHGFKTIEGDLLEAFQKLGIVDEESFKAPQMIHFQRAARTDKGVCQILSKYY